MKKIIFLALLLLVFYPLNVKGECDDSDITRLQKLARNINTSYNYDESKGRFTITFTNLKSDFLLKYYNLDEEYVVNGEITFDDLSSGKHVFEIYTKDEECYDDTIATRYISLPYYNSKYNSEECKGIENYSYCSKWVKNPIDNEIWETKVKQYKEKLRIQEENKKKNENSLTKKLIEFYKKYYYIILPSVIVVLAIFLIIDYNKNKLG